jgi:uncharacterized protein (DUF952 family)
VTPLFRIISSGQWEHALSSGVVPRCGADERRGRIHLNERADIERVASLWFSPEERPVALELDLTSVASSIKWARREEPPIEVWPNLYLEAIPIELVVAIYSLQPSHAGGRFELGMRKLTFSAP